MLHLTDFATRSRTRFGEVGAGFKQRPDFPGLLCDLAIDGPHLPSYHLHARDTSAHLTPPEDEQHEETPRRPVPQLGDTAIASRRYPQAVHIAHNARSFGCVTFSLVRRSRSSSNSVDSFTTNAMSLNGPLSAGSWLRGRLSPEHQGMSYSFAYFNALTVSK